MAGGLHLADYIVIVGYFVLLSAIGVYFWKRMRNARDLFTGGNNIPWWLAGVSFYLTGFSALSFVMYTEMAYKHGLVAVTQAWSAAAAMAIGTKFLAARWRRARLVSPVEFLEARYNKHIRQIIAWTGIPLRIIDDGLKIYATGLFVSLGMGLDLQASILLCAGVMLLYTFMGGLWAVVITDYVQFIILTLGVVVLFPLVFSAAGGLSALSAHPAPGSLSAINEPYSLLYVFAFYLLITLSYNGSWAFAQKFLCTRNEQDARKAGYLATALKIIGPPLFILPAMAAPGLLPEISPKDTYATLALTYLPAGLMGLMIAAMFSATMSTLSGDYNAVASVITQDIYARIFDKNASEKRLVWVGRLATLVVGTLAAGIGIAVMATKQKSLFDVMVTVFSIFTGPMLIPFLAGLLTRRVTAFAAGAGIVTGLVSGISFFVYDTWLRDGTTGGLDFKATTILVNYSVTIIAMVVAGLLKRPDLQQRHKIDAFFAQLERPIEPEQSTAPGSLPAFSPMPVIGWVTIGTGILLLISTPVQPGGMGRLITLAVAVVLVAIGGSFHWLRKRSARVVVPTAMARFSSSAEVDR
ncbi:MAG: sodium/solute symporter [Kofleriaceae bacterium]